MKWYRMMVTRPIPVVAANENRFVLQVTAFTTLKEHPASSLAGLLS